jgi:hypothetical protein
MVGVNFKVFPPAVVVTAEGVRYEIVEVLAAVAVGVPAPWFSKVTDAVEAGFVTFQTRGDVVANEKSVFPYTFNVKVSSANTV